MNPSAMAASIERPGSAVASSITDSRVPATSEARPCQAPRTRKMPRTTTITPRAPLPKRLMLIAAFRAVLGNAARSMSSSACPRMAATTWRRLYAATMSPVMPSNHSPSGHVMTRAATTSAC